MPRTCARIARRIGSSRLKRSVMRSSEPLERQCLKLHLRLRTGRYRPAVRRRSAAHSATSESPPAPARRSCRCLPFRSASDRARIPIGVDREFDQRDALASLGVGRVLGLRSVQRRRCGWHRSTVRALPIATQCSVARVGFAELLIRIDEQRVRCERERILRRAGGSNAREHLGEIRLGRSSALPLHEVVLAEPERRDQRSARRGCDSACGIARTPRRDSGFDCSTLPSRIRWIAGFEVQVREQTGRPP